MVHGHFYGIQYEIHLTKALDFYNDLLPIWMEVRTRIEMEKDKESGINKLILIPHEEFDQQLYNNKVFNEYIRENEAMCCDLKDFGENFIRNSKYYMVRQYKKLIKRNTSLPEPMTKQAYDELVKEWKKIEQMNFTDEKMNDDEWKEFNTKRSNIYNELNIQRIIHDPEYFEEIKKLEKKLLEQVNFTKEQGELIQNVLQKILTHPKLESIISWHGLNLVDGYY
jgi:hypothetical protein